MADLIVRGMGMPKGVGRIATIYPDGRVVDYINNSSVVGVSAIPLPEKHGRLGDLDKLEESLRMVAAYQTGERQQGILDCCETIRMAKTIIPAEGGTDDG